MILPSEYSKEAQVLPNLYNNPTRVKKIGIAALIVVAVLVVFLAVQQATQGTLSLVIEPADSTIMTSSGKHLKNGSNTLSGGKYTIIVSRDHFVKKSFTVQVASGKTVTSKYALTVADAAGLQYYIDNPDQKLIADGITGQKLSAQAEAAAIRYPIIQKLPEDGLTWRLDYGKSKLYPNDTTKVALYLTSQDETAKAAALQWMNSQGYPPNKYEIIYQDVATYSQQVNGGSNPSADSTVDSTPTNSIDYN
jgi:hypothetical protein